MAVNRIRVLSGENNRRQSHELSREFDGGLLIKSNGSTFRQHDNDWVINNGSLAIDDERISIDNQVINHPKKLRDIQDKLLVHKSMPSGIFTEASELPEEVQSWIDEGSSVINHRDELSMKSRTHLTPESVRDLEYGLLYGDIYSKYFGAKHEFTIHAVLNTNTGGFSPFYSTKCQPTSSVKIRSGSICPIDESEIEFLERCYPIVEEAMKQMEINFASFNVRYNEKKDMARIVAFSTEIHGVLLDKYSKAIREYILGVM